VPLLYFCKKCCLPLFLFGDDLVKQLRNVLVLERGAEASIVDKDFADCEVEVVDRIWLPSCADSLYLMRVTL